MPKKLIILCAAILVLAGGLTLLAACGRLPGSSLSGDGTVEGVETATPTRPAITSQPATPVTTDTPTLVVPTSEKVSSSPICFTPLELPPLAFSPDGSMLAVRARSGVQVFNLETGALTSFVESSQELASAAISPDWKTLAWALPDGKIQLVDFSTQDILADLIGHPDPALHLLFSPTGDRLFSASHDGLVRIWDMKGSLLSAIDAGAEVLGIGISADGSKLATIPFDGPVRVWELAANTKIMELGGSGGYDTSAAYFSPGGQYLAADLATGIYLWRLSDGSLVWNQVKNSMAVNFSPDGQYLVYSDIEDGNKVFLASPETGKVIRQVDAMQSPAWELFFSPDSSRLAVTDGMEIRIWRVADGSLLAVGKSTCP